MVVMGLNRKYVLWLALALPALPVLRDLWIAPADLDLLLHPSGEIAARLMILALAITPLRQMFPRVGWLLWVSRHRRSIGVAAFLYALAHTVLYVVDMETIRNMLAEFLALGIWTGWLAFLIFLPLALTSTDGAVRWLGRRWKLLHRTVYLAAVLTLVHWIFVHNNLVPALVHFVPLALLETYRMVRAFRGRSIVAPG